MSIGNITEPQGLVNAVINSLMSSMSHVNPFLVSCMIKENIISGDHCVCRLGKIRSVTFMNFTNSLSRLGRYIKMHSGKPF